MIKLYKWIRIVAYLFGLVGLAIVAAGKTRVLEDNQAMSYGGFALIICFSLLVVSYVVYVIIRMSAHR